MDIKELVDDRHQEKTPSELVGAPIHVIRGVSERDADLIQQAFGIKTVHEFANLSFIQLAQNIVALSEGKMKKDDRPFTVPTLIGVTTPSITIPSVTEGAIIEREAGVTTRGQDEEKCPTERLQLHMNFTAAILNVSGDIKVDPKSCPVRLDWADGPGGASLFQPGTDIGITVPLAAGGILTGNCIKQKDKCVCKWSFTRTSP